MIVEAIISSPPPIFNTYNSHNCSKFRYSKLIGTITFLGLLFAISSLLIMPISPVDCVDYEEPVNYDAFRSNQDHQEEIMEEKMQQQASQGQGQQPQALQNQNIHEPTKIQNNFRESQGLGSLLGIRPLVLLTSLGGPITGNGGLFNAINPIITDLPLQPLLGLRQLDLASALNNALNSLSNSLRILRPVYDERQLMINPFKSSAGIESYNSPQKDNIDGEAESGGVLDSLRKTLGGRNLQVNPKKNENDNYFVKPKTEQHSVSTQGVKNDSANDMIFRDNHDSFSPSSPHGDNDIMTEKKQLHRSTGTVPLVSTSYQYQQQLPYNNYNNYVNRNDQFYQPYHQDPLGSNFYSGYGYSTLKSPQQEYYDNINQIRANQYPMYGFSAPDSFDIGRLGQLPINTLSLLSNPLAALSMSESNPIVTALTSLQSPIGAAIASTTPLYTFIKTAAENSRQILNPAAARNVLSNVENAIFNVGSRIQRPYSVY